MKVRKAAAILLAMSLLTGGVTIAKEETAKIPGFSGEGIVKISRGGIYGAGEGPSKPKKSKSSKSKSGSGKASAPAATQAPKSIELAICIGSIEAEYETEDGDPVYGRVAQIDLSGLGGTQSLSAQLEFRSSEGDNWQKGSTLSIPADGMLAIERNNGAGGQTRITILRTVEGKEIAIWSYAYAEDSKDQLNVKLSAPTMVSGYDADGSAMANFRNISEDTAAIGILDDYTTELYIGEDDDCSVFGFGDMLRGARIGNGDECTIRYLRERNGDYECYWTETIIMGA